MTSWKCIFFSGTSVSADLKQRRVSLCSSSVETGLCIRTIDKGKIGSSSTNDPQQWQACLDAAIASGRLATPMVWKGLPDPVALPDADLAFDPALFVEPETANDLLRGMLDGATAYPDATVTSGGAGISGRGDRFCEQPRRAVRIPAVWRLDLAGGDQRPVHGI